MRRAGSTWLKITKTTAFIQTQHTSAKKNRQVQRVLYNETPHCSTLLWHDFENQFSIDNRLLVGAISGPIFQVGNSYTESCISSYLTLTTRRNDNQLQRSQYIFLFLNKICRRFIYNLGLQHHSRSNAVFWVPQSTNQFSKEINNNVNVKNVNGLVSL